MHKLLLSFCLLLLTSPLLAAVHRGGAELLNPKAYSVFTSAKVFQTSASYNTEGEEVELADTSAYRLIDIDLNVAYGVSRNLQIGFLSRLRSVSSTLNDEVTTKSGPESIGGEVKYAFDPIGKLRYAVGAHYRQTLYSNASYAPAATIAVEELVLGDAGSEYGVDLYMTYLNNSWKLDTKIGYSSAANDLSSEVPYKIEGLYRFTKLSLLAGIDGVYSLKNDPYTDDLNNRPKQATGATALFNSYNREFIAPYIGMNYALDKMIIGLKGQTVVSGVSTDKGNSFLMSVGWSSDGITAESIKLDSFKEYQVDGSVLKVSVRGNFIRIDQGLSTDVEKGMKFDIYQTDYFGGNVLVASGIAYEVGSDWSVIKLVKTYTDITIKPGFAARGY